MRLVDDTSTREAVIGGLSAAFLTANLDPISGAMHLDEEETAALIKELHDIVENDPYPFSPRIRTLRAILAKLRPEPVREPMAPRKVYAPPRFTRGRQRRE